MTPDPTAGPDPATDAPFLLSAMHRIRPLDWLMLLLAILSIGLLSWETFWTVSDTQRDWILRADYAICAAFFAEFLWSWKRAGWSRGYALRNWYEVLGMIPVSSPALRGFRLFRVVRIVVLLSRFGIAADRAFGDEFAYRMVNRFQGAIIEAIGTTVTMAVLNEVADVLEKGRYAGNTAHVMRRNHDEVKALLLQKLREDPAYGRLSKLPFYGELSQMMADASLRVVVEVLADQRTDSLLADVLQANVEQLREAVEHKQREKLKRRADPPV